ncbi:outer envelope pore protein 24B, chloroplastic [Physcomitrium patens]|uniref:Outer envelope pore protein 24, chloroplastic n=1 Tax=Physcomitrium patens TaxID=3218 RepID=A9SCY3_PHYPA|nr:outer envelope pore protein 24B, chloroplastic-like [Physcomitrium patens]PNR39922.1 hypothetical protein PHYPA_020202 [Physcomitrium patens]|eukprot:XP_024396406.1 outer envelope pore protein 24B, chloroplastic-like [Physcomitrella patens]
MSKAQVKTKYDAAANAATATLSFPVGDLKLKATCADSTIVPGEGLSSRGVALGVEKPGTFMIDYDMHTQAPRFQFMAGANIAKKPLRLTYIHAQKRNMTVLEGSVSIDTRNKVTGKYSFNTNKGSLKYTYVHGSGATLEPSYDFGTEAWHFAASKKVGPHDHARFCFDAQQSTVGIEWTRDSKEYGQFKITATVPTDASKTPKLVAEKTWTVDF